MNIIALNDLDYKNYMNVASRLKKRTRLFLDQ